MHQLTARVRSAGALVLAALVLMLTGCTVPGGGPLPGEGGSREGTASQRRATTKVALLLPLTATGHTAAVAKAMKQAGELALFEQDDPGFQLIVKDDKGTPEGARAAAEEAVGEGAELVLGPLFARSVEAAAPVARRAGIPVLAFSNDRRVAGEGIYLLGFLPQQEVDRVVSFAIAQGHRRFAALVPDDAYGQLAQAAFRNAVARGGGAIAVLETYPAETNRMVEPTQRVVAAVRQADEGQQPVDALFLPGGPETLPSLGPLLAYASFDTGRIRLLGSGGWDYPNIGRDKAFVGGWYPSGDPRGWGEFSERFAKTFGGAPPRLASMAYDAVSIAIKLSLQPAGNRYTKASLTRAEGFAGVDGPMRLVESGITERSLAVLEVQSMGSKVVDPPGGFGALRLPSPASRVN